MSLVTLDANVLVYAIEAGHSKQEAALGIIAGAVRSGGLITVQALGEFFAAATRKRKILGVEAMGQVIRWGKAFGSPVAHDAAGLPGAMAAATPGRFSFWDAMLLASAEAAGCTAIISEDMAPGARLGRIRVIPAFAGDAVSPEALALLT